MPEQILMLPRLPEKFVTQENLNELQQWIWVALQEFQSLTDENPKVACYTMDLSRYKKVSSELSASHRALCLSLQKPSTPDLQTQIQIQWETFALNLQRLGPIENISNFTTKHRIQDCQCVVVKRNQQQHTRQRWSHMPKFRGSKIQAAGGRQLPPTPTKGKPTNPNSLFTRMIDTARKRWSGVRPPSAISTSKGTKRLSEMAREAGEGSPPSPTP